MIALTEPPASSPRTFLEFPYAADLDKLNADIAILGIPFGKPYQSGSKANEQSRAPDAIRRASMDIDYTLGHYDWDLGGPLLDNRPLRVVDCGNVTADASDHDAHYRRAEEAARKIFSANATLLSLGGDHGIPIPVFRALEVCGSPVTLIHIDAHLDWRHEINGETEGYSSPIRRAAELAWVGDIIQIGMRGIGSARLEEVDDARKYGAKIVTAYELHAIGMQAVLEQIPDGGPYYLSIDADGVDPTIMPAVVAQTPGGLNWFDLHTLIHGLSRKGRLLGMDLVEIAPAQDVANITMIHAERLMCNFIGAVARSGVYD